MRKKSFLMLTTLTTLTLSGCSAQASNTTPLGTPQTIIGTIIAVAVVSSILIIILARQNTDTLEEATQEPTTQEDISALTGTDIPQAEIQPLPEIGHPDDTGIPVPDFTTDPTSPVVNTNLPTIDVNADVPVAPVPVLDAPVDAQVETVILETNTDAPFVVDPTLNDTDTETSPENT